ncbi:MAG TPA: sulfatase-like hydrolase/transferase [Anaerolineales bacterium]|nr:sulfatase-like hydrolase/transferase [Anaerolineales bacterium]
MSNLKHVKKTLGGWFSVPWYPILFGAYPVLALLAFNAGQVKVEAAWRPLLICVGIAAILFFLLKLILRDWQRAAFLSTLWMALIFSYGHIHILLTEKLKDFDFTPWLLLAWFVLAILAAVWASKKPPSSALALNVIALGLVISVLVQIDPNIQGRGAHSLGAKNAPVQDLARPQNPPDVYYFILDSYGRADLLEQAYGYDNSAFIDGLQARGFYVAECSQSNYVRTEISVASSLNMSYLQGLDPAFVPDSTRRRVLWDSFKHNAARYNFESMGYKTIAFATGFAWNELEDADVFYTPPPFSAGMTEFEVLFMQTTLAREVQELGWVDADEIMGQNFRDRTLLVFDRMDEIARMPEPTFAFVHVISPHPPFVFGPNGEPTYPADFWNEDREYPADLYAKGYQNQLTFLNKKVLEAMDTLLSESDTPPIIILQGDHGPWLQPKNKRFLILNAYYLPENADQLYPKISPVNTFRLIFNSYFGGKYDMLDDLTYFSPVPKLYEFSDIPYPCEK